MNLPVALTCGDPSGVGPELALAARLALGATLPLFWIGDPRHLASVAFQEISTAAEAASVPSVVFVEFRPII